MSDDVVVDQIAALPVYWDKAGKLRVLMVTSRDRGRWVMPKGWLMDGKTPWMAAEIEALEEAGAVGFISDKPVGKYYYDKRLEGSDTVRCCVTLYPLVVENLKRRWKESKQRKRHWFSPEKAAMLVEEDDLVCLLNALASAPEMLKVLEKLRNAA